MLAAERVWIFHDVRSGRNPLSFLWKSPLAFARAARFVQASSKQKVALPACDAVLLCPNKSAKVYPATALLAERLAEKGFRCALVVGTSTMTIFHPSTAVNKVLEAESFPGYRTWMGRASDLACAFRLLHRSLAALAALHATLLAHGPSVRSVCLPDPFHNWLMLLGSAARIERWNALLGQLSPRLLIVNDVTVPVASELLLAGPARSSYRIMINREAVDPVLFPIMVDEVWTWNQTFADWIRSVAPSYELPALAIVGSGEVDDALLHQRQESGNVTGLNDLSNGRPAFLFLSTGFGSAQGMGPISAEAARWMADAARRCPDWLFIYKTRPGRADNPIPGEKCFKGLTNVHISRGDRELREFLTWDKLAVVGALGSNGLYMAAGMGKLACRLLVSRRQRPNPVIDEIAIPVDSPDDLVSVLARVRPRATTSPDAAPLADDARFPYRGHVLDRMTSLALRHLQSGSHASVGHVVHSMDEAGVA